MHLSTRERLKQQQQKICGLPQFSFSLIKNILISRLQKFQKVIVDLFLKNTSSSLFIAARIPLPGRYY